MNSELYTPSYLKLWQLPESYFGAQWPDHYVFLGRNRNSDALTRSNFRSGLEAIGGEKTDDESEIPLVQIVRESHWAVGWVEWIAIHKTATDALKAADEIAKKLDDYPVVDEEDFSREEQEEADETWKNCFDEKERVKYIRKYRSQFEFRSFADLFGCVRGKYFAGYAGDLLN